MYHHTGAHQELQQADTIRHVCSNCDASTLVFATSASMVADEQVRDARCGPLLFARPQTWVFSSDAILESQRKPVRFTSIFDFASVQGRGGSSGSGGSSGAGEFSRPAMHGENPWQQMERVCDQCVWRVTHGKRAAVSSAAATARL